MEAPDACVAPATANAPPFNTLDDTAEALDLAMLRYTISRESFCRLYYAVAVAAAAASFVLGSAIFVASVACAFNWF